MIRRLFLNQRRQIQKETMTPLAKELRSSIKINGALSMQQFIRSCLVHPEHGYYMKKDAFGLKGDFITSPEISQMFGEIWAIWFIKYFQDHMPDGKIQLVELGPGRGTLMFDILNTFQQFPFIYKKIERVSLVDASPYMQGLQQQKLKKFNNDIKFEWYDRLADVPNQWSMYIAHEFFDALPIYQFKMTDNGFREVLVDINDDEHDKEHFKPALSRNQTKSLMLLENQPQFKNCNKDEIIQLSTDTWDISCMLGARIEKDGGCALIADYGESKIRSDRLRGIKDHKFVSPFQEPGLVDLSTDVEFDFIKYAVEKNGAQFFGPLTQGEFLSAMGIAARLMTLLTKVKTSAERHELVKAYERLVKNENMGKVYQICAITRKANEPPYPLDKSFFLNESK